MKYLYGDSMEFPMRKDFLGLLNEFMDTSVNAITHENNVFDLKENIKDRRRLKNSVLDEMDNFLQTVENAIGEAIARTKEQEAIIKYADKSKVFLKKYIDEGKQKFSDEIFQEIAQFEEKVNKADEENRKILESFFIGDPVPIINKKYMLNSIKDGYLAKVQVECEGGITPIFEIASSEIPFWDGHVKAFDFIRGIEIPARMKKPFLKKELVPDIINIDNYLLTDLILSGKELEIVFRKRYDTASDRFRLKMDFTGEFSAEVFHADENGVEQNIMVAPELKNEINMLRMRELGEKIIEQTNNLYPKKQKLETLKLNDRNVFEENLVFELMQKVAEIYNPTVIEIKKKSPSQDELSLKAEDERGKRSEIYLKKRDARQKLGAIQEKGDKLLEILDIL